MVAGAFSARAGAPVDFGFAPPEWQTAICLPDDPCKSLVDKSGELLYHFGSGRREFATRVSIEVARHALWQKQELHSPRVPIARTFRTAEGLRIVEEAFAVTDLPRAAGPPPILRRLDGDAWNEDWAHPEGDIDAALRDIALHNGGSLLFEAEGTAYRVALALCEGYWDQPGKRVQVLRVEGAEPKTVDTVADIGRNKAALFWFDAKDADGDGKIRIAVDPADRSADRNTILNGLWLFAEGTAVDEAGLLSGQPTAEALARMSPLLWGGPPRNDLILVRVTNTADGTRTIAPRLIVDTTRGCRLDGQRARLGGGETIIASLDMRDLSKESPTLYAIQLAPVSMRPGEAVEFAAVYCGGGATVAEPSTVAGARAARERAIRYWERAPLPYGRIEVPDAGIQALLDSSIRNIWQAREIKKDLPVFQVGPTCYRGLWIVDGAFLLEAATMLGAGDQARSGVAYELTHQQPDGRIEVMNDYPKENGIVLWTCVRHARLTQDRPWLESVWPRLTRIAEHIRTLRRQTLRNDSALDDGLIPPGFPDGGIGGVHYEYTNPYWSLAGLRSWVEAARWLGRPEEAAEWQREYDEFMAAFRRAAARDMRKDAHGNPFLPILMGEAGVTELPQRSQWAFCHAVYPGQLFARDDPLVAGNMAMLEATEREGMVHGTGWDADGIWNYFASFYGHAWLWQGQGRKAARVLYAYANHAAPVLVWREEQSLKGERFRKVGDMPHNWASAEFIRLAIHLLALDRGDELHLLEGLPSEWTRPGSVTRLAGIATPFGPLSMELEIDGEGTSARLRVEPLADAACRRVVVHLSGWATDDRDAVIELDPGRRTDRAIPLRPAGGGRQPGKG